MLFLLVVACSFLLGLNRVPFSCVWWSFGSLCSLFAGMFLQFSLLACSPISFLFYLFTALLVVCFLFSFCCHDSSFLFSFKSVFRCIYRLCAFQKIRFCHEKKPLQQKKCWLAAERMWRQRNKKPCVAWKILFGDAKKCCGKNPQPAPC